MGVCARVRARVCVSVGVLLFVVFSVSFCFVFANFAPSHQCTLLTDFFQMKSHCDC